MKLLIDIPEHIYEHAKETTEDSRDEFDAMRAIANGTQQETREEAFDNFIKGFKEIETRPNYKIHSPYYWECYYEIEALLNECIEEVENNAD